MTQIDRSRIHTTTQARARLRSPRAGPEPDRRPNVRRVSEAVVASYIHEISERHRRDKSVSPALPARR
jgi:hypothetical protein